MSKSPVVTEYLPFVHTERDCQLLNGFYRDSPFVRVPLQHAKKLVQSLPQKTRLWIDAELDGLHQLNTAAEPFVQYIKQFAHWAEIVDTAFHAKPEPRIVDKFVDSVLSSCAEVNPKLVSVPQFPIASDASRNKINKELARATSRWVRKRPEITMILPVIFTHQAQTKNKTTRNPKVAQIRQCFDAANAKGVWVADATLNDQDGAGTLDARFRALIEMHQELAASLPDNTSVVAGPYWGINLVLWSRGIVRYPAVTLGNRYRYHLSGGRTQKPNTRVALDPIKRLVVAKPELAGWLRESLKRIPGSDPASIEFAALSENLAAIWQGDNREQICRVYRKWLDSVADVPTAGRALTLYQQLSSAYVLGRTLGDLPEEGPSRRPERVAQQLMLLCL